MKRTDQGSARAIMLVLAFLAAISPARATNSDASAPQRVVSMNLCTDQLALVVAAPAQLRSVSYISHDPHTSVLAAKARRYQPNHGLAEEIFLMRPDLILAGGFTRRATTDLLRRLGFRVEIFYPAQSVAGIGANLRRMGKLLGREHHAGQLATAFEADLARLRAKNPAQPRKRAALYYANNYTSGGGTLAADIVAHAGLENIGSRLGLSGMVKLPLELLVMGKPDLIISERRDGQHPALAYQTFTHPALDATTGNTAARLRTDTTWSCGAPFTLDAILSLKAAAEALTPRRTLEQAPATGASR